MGEPPGDTRLKGMEKLCDCQRSRSIGGLLGGTMRCQVISMGQNGNETSSQMNTIPKFRLEKANSQSICSPCVGPPLRIWALESIWSPLYFATPLLLQ